jgi:hypothetical protein
MSLIQQALDKTSRAQQTRTMTPVLTPKPWERDPMGARLEQELVQVQSQYAKRRDIFRKVALGALLACVIAGLVYFGIRNNPSDVKTLSVMPSSVPVSSVTVEARPMPQVPLRISSGNIYRLTGVTNIGDKAIAVINNRLVGVGDALDGQAVVKTIGNGEVRLDVQGQEIRLTL